MEQYSDLVSYIEGIASIKAIRKQWLPFDNIAVERPAMGTIGAQHPYYEDLKRPVELFESDIKKENLKNVFLSIWGMETKSGQLEFMLSSKKK